MEIVDQSRIFLQPNSAPPSAIPLSFLDIPWFFLRSPVQRLLFYNVPGYSALQFTNTALPSIKHSLSVALQRFYPLAGSLACALPTGKPQILCSDNDSVSFTAAVSSADFDEVTSDSPQDASLLHHLVPPLGPSVVKDGARVAPLFAVQVTLFPSKGMCIGVHFLHIVADGMAFSHFMKTWASICRAEQEGDSKCILKSLPVLDRSLMKDPNGLETTWSQDGWKLFSPWEQENNSPSPTLPASKLRATFTLSRAHIDQLKSWILNQAGEPLHVSTFVATCAYTWTCLIKSMEAERARFSNTDVYYFAFVADCRGRLGYRIPDAYFGNCLSLCYVALKREDLVGRQGTLSAARVIGAKVKELGEEDGPFRRAERLFLDGKEILKTGRVLSVAGTTRQRFYDTDFGWGRAWKSRVVHIDTDGAISLSESREEEGGVELGLAAGKATMDAFCVMFEQGLRSLDG